MEQDSSPETNLSVIDSELVDSSESPKKSSASISSQESKSKLERGKVRAAKKRGRRVKSTTPKIINLYNQGYSQAEIVKLADVDKAYVSRVVKKFFKDLPSAEEIGALRKKRVDIIDSAVFLSLKSTLDESKHGQASLRDAAQAFKILNEASRMERGLSVRNVAISFNDITSPEKPSE